LARWNQWWNLFVLAGRQLVVGAAAVAAVAAIRRRKTGGVPEPLVGMIIVAFALNITMRTSTWAATYYNPERSELHNAIVLSFAVAFLLDLFKNRGAVSRKLTKESKVKATFGRWLGRRIVGAVALGSVAVMVVVSFENTGLGSLAFKGSLRASMSESSESVERFVVSDAERRGVLWMWENITGGVIQTDRYGKMMAGGVLDYQAGVVDIIHPDYIDENAWVFATRSNLVEGRARGYLNNVFSVYSAPVDRLDRERSILYANDHVRIYR
jgi:hypothetical protein